MGLAEHEVVLRGGFLKAPVVIGGCRLVHGATYLPLLKGDPVISNFLSPRPCNKRPLRGTRLPEELQKLRNDFILTMCVDPAERAFAEDLALCGHVLSTKRRRHTPTGESALPPTVVVVYKKDGFADWAVRVLVDRYIRMAPSIEVTTENLRELFDRVRADLQEGSIVCPRRGGAAGAKRPPRGEPGCRRFWTGRRWLEKRPVEETGAAATSHASGAAGSGSRARRTKFRTLTVKPSIAVSPSPGRGRPRREPRAAVRTEADLPEVPPVEESGWGDDFGV